jgi:hypothetical protein
MKKLEPGVKVEIISTSPKSLPESHVSVPRHSKQEIIMGILIMICGILTLIVSNYLIKNTPIKKNPALGIAWLVGNFLVAGGFILLLIGVFLRRFIKWDMKRTTGASQIAEGSNGEYIEVYEE